MTLKLYQVTVLYSYVNDAVWPWGEMSTKYSVQCVKCAEYKTGETSWSMQTC
jgi:hypothetical protein